MAVMCETTISNFFLSSALNGQLPSSLPSELATVTPKVEAIAPFIAQLNLDLDVCDLSGSHLLITCSGFE